MTTETLKDRLQRDLITARKARDAERTSLLSMTLSEVKNAEIDKGSALGDDELLQVVSRAIKRRKEAADQMRAARPELAAKEEREAEWLQAYMPAPLDEAAVRALVREAVAGGAADLGAVMGRVMPLLRGRFDGKEANRIVREELGS
ncbi:MAG: GatB/YqeY domain-containing protein [Gemmatimonadota bacterium]